MKVTKEVPTQDFDVVIVLGRYEASVLLKVLNNIGGDPYNSPRKVMKELKGHLVDAGVYPVDVEVSGAVRFNRG